jgi:hypothetical protein
LTFITFYAIINLVVKKATKKYLMRKKHQPEAG